MTGPTAQVRGQHRVLVLARSRITGRPSPSDRAGGHRTPLGVTFRRQRVVITRTDMDVHPRERKPGIIGQRPEERELFETLLGEHLVDVGRALDPDNPSLFTWWAPWRNLRQRNIGWRLDYILASPAIAARAASCVVQADVGTSDHAPVVMVSQ